MSANQPKCLNCGNVLIGKFCNNCGQKADTHRITLKHFITHDLIHGVWHVEKGLFFTIKESLLRAGKASMEYIEGKRIKYYNVFYLSLLLLGLNIFLIHYFQKTPEHNLEIGGDMTAVTEFFKSNIKIIILLFIPVISINAYFIFRKSKLNIAEQMIIVGFLFCGMIFLSILQNLLDAIPPPFENFLDFTLIPIIDAVLLLLPAYTYYQAFSKKYSKVRFLVRLFFFYLLNFVIYLIILFAIIIMFNYLHTGKMELEGTFQFTN